MDAWPRDRVPDQRRGPGPQLPAEPGPDLRLRRAGRAGHPLGLPRLPGLPRAAALRLDGRQADHPPRDPPQGGDRQSRAVGRSASSRSTGSRRPSPLFRADSGALRLRDGWDRSTPASSTGTSAVDEADRARRLTVVSCRLKRACDASRGRVLDAAIAVDASLDGRSGVLTEVGDAMSRIGVCGLRAPALRGGCAVSSRPDGRPRLIENDAREVGPPRGRRPRDCGAARFSDRRRRTRTAIPPVTSPRVERDDRGKHRLDGLVAIGGDGTLGAAAAREAAKTCPSSGAEDDRQRCRGDRLHLRVLHGGRARDRGARPAAHDRRGARADHGRRVHGAHTGWITGYAGVVVGGRS